MKPEYILGIDESYTRTGLTLLNKEGSIIEMLSLNYCDCNNNTEKRNLLSATIYELIGNYTNVLVIIERIRLRSQGVLSQSYIISTGALIATIVDVCYSLGIQVYSVDTRAWKFAIVGTSKPLDNPYGIDPHKYPTILYMRNLGLLSHIAYPYKGKGKKGVIPMLNRLTGIKENYKINDDIADSYCIARYGLLPKTKQKLQLET